MTSLGILLDISKSMMTKDVNFNGNDVVDYFSISPDTNNEKFLIYLDEIKNHNVITRCDAENILAHALKEELRTFVDEVAIGWYNSDASVIKNQNKNTYWFKLKKASIPELKALSLIFYRISRAASAGTNLSLGLKKIGEILARRKNKKLLIITDSFWNIGVSPFSVIDTIDTKISVIFINNNVNTIDKRGLFELVEETNGKFIEIKSITRDSIGNLETLKSWLVD